MGRTLAEKIISAHTETPVKAGDLCIAKVDVTAVQDGTGPLTISEFKKLGIAKPANPERMILFIDHATPSPRKELSNSHMVMRELQKKQVQSSQKVAQAFATKDWSNNTSTLEKSSAVQILIPAHQVH